MEHHVYFWLKEEKKNEADRAAFENGLDALMKIETIASGVWGVPSDTPERPVTDKSFDYAISLKFDSVEQHNIYQEHPEHHVFVESFLDYWQEVKVMDMG